MTKQNPYAPPPVFPRPWLDLPPGVFMGIPKGTPSPNPYNINWPTAQLSHPAMLPFSTNVRLANQKPAKSRPVAAGVQWPSAQFVPVLPQHFDNGFGDANTLSAYEESRDTWKKVSKGVLLGLAVGAVLLGWTDRDRTAGPE